MDQGLEAAGAERAAVVLCDVQGAETLLLESSITTLARQTRFLVLSTHHETISGRADTHEYCLSILRQWGAHIIAEHRIDESFSGDGLIAVSFDECDRDLNVEVSVCRRADSLFGEVNVQELRDHAAGLAVALEKANVFAASLEAHSSALQDSLQAAEEYAESLRASFAEAEEYALDLRRTLDDLSA